MILILIVEYCIGNNAIIWEVQAKLNDLKNFID